MKYRKKPVVIEAFQYDGDLKGADGKYYVPDWAAKAFESGTLYYDSTNQPPTELKIKTLEGDMTASVGDYIIRGVNGELYPCKPDIFLKTYENVTEEPKIRIESDGKTVKLFVDGEHVKGRAVDFHGDAEDGVHVKWDCDIIKYNKAGEMLFDGNKPLTEKYHFDNLE